MFRAYLDAATELVFPVDCIGCRAPGVRVCQSCRIELRQPITWSAADLPHVHSAGHYSGLLRQVIIARKAHGDRGVLPALAGLTAAALAAARHPTGQAVPVVPVPASRRSLRARGVNVVTELAHAAGAQVIELLRVRAQPRDQIGLGGAQRAANLAGAFEAVTTGSGAVVLLDDVFTTGATVREALRALQVAGFDVTSVATVAIAGEERKPKIR